MWTIRVDVHVLNHNGNLIDAASMAAISALVHFRRPDVSVSGEDVTIVRFHFQLELSVLNMRSQNYPLNCVYYSISLSDLGNRQIQNVCVWLRSRIVKCRVVFSRNKS